ncbi:hypothetical protein HYV11_04020 [Candidatus Dependentiae bacterium]|nr:hypothetical protein [Candidatus Dependentiae bacterium]
MKKLQSFREVSYIPAIAFSASSFLITFADFLRYRLYPMLSYLRQSGFRFCS